jgi:hypothetical protein
MKRTEMNKDRKERKEEKEEGSKDGRIKNKRNNKK